MKSLKIAYYTEVDLSLNDGPAVNEMEFLNEISNFSDNKFIFVTIKKNNKFSNAKHTLFVPDFKLKLILFHFFKNLIIAIKVLRSNQDILVCRISDFPLFPFFYKLLNRKKKIAIKTAALWYVDQKNVKNTFKNIIYKKLNNYIIKKVYNWADILDTALPYSVKKLQKINFVGKNNVFLIENGINIQKFSRKGRTASVEALKKSYPILGFMGSKPSFRGAKQALEVAKSIKSEYPNVAVLILGSDSELKKLLLEYKKYNFTIHALGVVNYSHIEEYVRLMTIGFSFYESDVVGEHGNASQKVRQYLACGKPVFSTHHNHEFVKDNSLGYIFNDEDHEFMAEKALVWIKKINEQGEMLEKYISDYAARNFSCSSTFAKRIHLYRDLLGNGHDTNR